MTTERDRIYEELGSRIKRHREVAGLSQADLAEAVGRTERTVERYETGKQAPPLHEVYRIASVLRLGISKLVTDGWTTPRRKLRKTRKHESITRGKPAEIERGKMATTIPNSRNTGIGIPDTSGSDSVATRATTKRKGKRRGSSKKSTKKR